MMNHGYTKAVPCFWCEKPMPLGVKTTTADHLLPRWFRKFVRESMGDSRLIERWHGTVWCCVPCNQAKGPMPPASFAKYRLAPTVCALELTRWNGISAHFGWGAFRDPSEPALFSMAREMLEHFDHRGMVYPGHLEVIVARAQQRKVDWQKRQQARAADGVTFK